MSGGTKAGVIIGTMAAPTRPGPPPLRDLFVLKIQLIHNWRVALEEQAADIQTRHAIELRLPDVNCKTDWPGGTPASVLPTLGQRARVLECDAATVRAHLTLAENCAARLQATFERRAKQYLTDPSGDTAGHEARTGQGGGASILAGKWNTQTLFDLLADSARDPQWAQSS